MATFFRTASTWTAFSADGGGGWLASAARVLARGDAWEERDRRRNELECRAVHAAEAIDDGARHLEPLVETRLLPFKHGVPRQRCLARALLRATPGLGVGIERRMGVLPRGLGERAPGRTKCRRGPRAGGIAPGVGHLLLLGAAGCDRGRGSSCAGEEHAARDERGEDDDRHDDARRRAPPRRAEPVEKDAHRRVAPLRGRGAPAGEEPRNGARRWSKRLVERDAEAVLVGACVDLLAGALLRSHVRERALRRAVGAEAEREPEVADEDAPVDRDEDVLRLEVAMNEARVVRGAEALSGLQERVEDRAGGVRAACEPLPERDPVDERHDEEHASVDAPHVVDCDDVRMREQRHRPRLGEEPVLGDPEVAAEDLHRDDAMKLRIDRLVDDTHSAAAEDAPENEAPDAVRLVVVDPDGLHRADEDPAIGAAVEVLGERRDRGLVEVALDERLKPCFRRAVHRLAV